SHPSDCHRHCPPFPTRRSSDLEAVSTDESELGSEFVAAVRLHAVDPGVAFGFERKRQSRAQVMRPRVTRACKRRKTRGVLGTNRSEEHTSELQSREKLVCRPLL